MNNILYISMKNKLKNTVDKANKFHHNSNTILYLKCVQCKVLDIGTVREFPGYNSLHIPSQCSCKCAKQI